MKLFGEGFDEQSLRFGIFGAIVAAAKNNEGKIIERGIGFIVGVLTSVSLTPFLVELSGFKSPATVAFFAFCVGYLGLKGLEKVWANVDLDALLAKVFKIKDHNPDETDGDTH